MITTAIYPSKCLTSNILHLLSDIASVTSVTSFWKFLYNKYIHLHPNVFLLRKFCILITLITQMYYIHLRYSWNSYYSCSTKNYQLCKQYISEDYCIDIPPCTIIKIFIQVSYVLFLTTDFTDYTDFDYAWWRDFILITATKVAISNVKQSVKSYLITALAAVIWKNPCNLWNLWSFYTCGSWVT